MDFILLAYRLIQTAIILVFTFFISDFRKKNQMIPLINPRLTLLLKFCNPIPILTTLVTFWIMEELVVGDLIALCFAALGTYIAAKAKLDLGKFHTWTGYFAGGPKFITTGLYAVIRHPLYTGIFMYMTACAITVILHAPLPGVVLFGVTCTYITIFLITSARRETAALEKQFGTQFQEYSRQVHSFLPLRRYQA
jgi:protein-S-isoprenylcysteine O-methyltransferase Ste14